MTVPITTIPATTAMSMYVVAEVLPSNIHAEDTVSPSLINILCRPRLPTVNQLYCPMLRGQNNIFPSNASRVTPGLPSGWVQTYPPANRTILLSEDRIISSPQMHPGWVQAQPAAPRIEHQSPSNASRVTVGFADQKYPLSIGRLSKGQGISSILIG